MFFSCVKNVIINTMGDNEKKPIIELKNIIKEFRIGKTMMRVLKDISLQIFPEEFVIILGPSGSGKSTLVNTILGLERPSSGSVVVQGRELTKLSLDQLARMRLKSFGVVYQRPDWVRSLSVLQNVAIPYQIMGRSTRESNKRAHELLARFNLDDHAKYSPVELSGGQQQRVEIARSLMIDADIIVADEPTGNLDSYSAEKVMEIFENLRKELHKTVIMVTHNMEYVRYATKTIYVRDGRVFQGDQTTGTNQPK